MAILTNLKLNGVLSSCKATGKKIMNRVGILVEEYVEHFLSGFSGYGWKIWEYIAGKWKLEIDSVVVRETMVVFELLIQKIRAIKGALSITQASGKIKTVSLDSSGGNWLITIEDEMCFVGNDFIRCQNLKNGVLRGYWVKIKEVRKIDGIDTIVVPVTEFAGGIDYVDGIETVNASINTMVPPSVGDDIVQFGNSNVKNRQSAIYMHADEGGQPAIDILFGINSKSFLGCTKIRVGGDIPGTNGIKGFYAVNGMLKGVNEHGSIMYCLHPDGTAELGAGSTMFKPDKSGYIAGGAISWQWDRTKQRYICAMGDVLLAWGNLSDETKENIKGESGKDGITYFTWIRYADNAVGSGISNDPSGKKYIGFAYNKTTQEESNTPSDYIWSSFHGEDGIPGTPGKDANLLPWVEEWDNNKTLIDGDSVVSPRMFSGERDPDTGKLTGIAQGKNCITINGVKRTGIFALVENEVVFELDPTTRKYLFKGRIEAEEGYFSGEMLSNSIKTHGINVNDNFIVYEDGRVNLTGNLESKSGENRIVIKPEGEWPRISFYKAGKEAMSIFMFAEAGYATAEPIIRMYGKTSRLINNTWTTVDTLTRITAGEIRLTVGDKTKTISVEN